MQTIALENLNPSAGFTIHGWASGSQGGLAVGGGSDINGDGYDDLIIASELMSYSGDRAGGFHVIFGSGSNSDHIDISLLSAAEGYAVFGSMPNARLGSSIAVAGDLNGDGMGDVLVGSRYLSEPYAFAGSVYAILGSSDAESAQSNSTDVSDLANFSLTGSAPFEAFGSSVQYIGDINGDGRDDFIVGAPQSDLGGRNAGAAFVVMSSVPSGTSGSIGSDLGQPTVYSIVGANDTDLVGWSVASAGDFNGDGLGDYAVTAPGSDIMAEDGGAVYLFYGTIDSGNGSIHLDDFDGDEGVIFARSASGFGGGLNINAVGDINGDGYGDVAIGAPSDSSFGEFSGSAWVIFGSADAGSALVDLDDLASNAGFRISNGPENAGAGYAVSGVGDINGDGFDDFAISAPYSSIGQSYAGATYVFYGAEGGSRSDIDLLDLSSSDGFLIIGASAEDLSGTSVNSAGDFNGDGFGDIIIGSPYSDASGDMSGEAYVIYGVGPDQSVYRSGTAVGQTILGGTFDDTLMGQGGDDTLEGGAGEDVIDGGIGYDFVSYVHATEGVAVRFNDGSGQRGDALGDTFSSVEGILGSRFRDTIGGDGTSNALHGFDGADTMFGNGGSDFVSGGVGDDRISGGHGADTLDGGSGNDLLKGGGGNDIFEFGVGNDSLDGGEGFDIALFEGKFDRYSMSEVGLGVWQVTDLVLGEVDTLQGVERLRFDDQVYVLV